MENKFIIVSPFYNVESTIKKTIMSVVSQDYKNYEAYFIDDVSTDNTVNIIEDLIKNNDKIKLIKNQNKKYSLRNIYDTVHKFSSDADIIVILDGDDILYGKDVLSKINYYYNSKKCWLTYGSYINLSNKTRGKFSSKIPQYVIDNSSYRDHSWCTSHLRSFKSFLFKKIKEEDMKDEAGHFLTITGDLAIMFPMLEMSCERSCYIDDLLYIWNDLNEHNDHKKDNMLQMKVEQDLRRRKKYDRLDR